MIRIFAVAILFSAALLFLIQPMAAKLVLPILGGSREALAPLLLMACEEMR